MIRPGKRWPRRSTDMNALLMDVLIGVFKEECALDMGQRGGRRRDAAVQGAQIKLRKEECAKDMGQRSHENDAAGKDAQIFL